MEKNRIPDDLKKEVCKKILLRVLACCFLFIFNTIIIVYWGNIILPLSDEHKVFRFFCYAIFLLLPFIITRIYTLWTDTSYTGTITDVKISTVVDSKSTLTRSLEMLYHKNEIYLTIKKDNGKIIKRKTYEGVSKLAQKLETYKVGDRVAHLHGTGITVVLPSANSTHCCCAVCGGVNEVSNTTCVHCEHSLIS